MEPISSHPRLPQNDHLVQERWYPLRYISNIEIGGNMKKILTCALLCAILVSGCGAVTPYPTATPTFLPTVTVTPSATGSPISSPPTVIPIAFPSPFPNPPTIVPTITNFLLEQQQTGNLRDRISIEEFLITRPNSYDIGWKNVEITLLKYGIQDPYNFQQNYGRERISMELNGRSVGCFSDASNRSF